MKAIIAVPAYDRLPLLKQCLDSLATNDRNLFDVLIAPDRTNVTDSLAIDLTVDVSGLGAVTIPRPQNRLGANANMVRSINAAFDLGDHSHIICIGSDLVVSDNFVHDLLVLSETYDCMSVSPIHGRNPIDVKLANVNTLIYGSISGTNLCIPRHHWKTIAPIVTAISKRFHVMDWNQKTIDDQRIVMRSMLEAARMIETKWTKPMIDHMGLGEINTGEDGLVVTALAFFGIPMASYTINRAIHPSDTGAHTTREVYEEWYAGVTLDDLPPAEPSKFKFV